MPVRATPIGLRIHPEGVAMLSKEPLGVVWVRISVSVRVSVKVRVRVSVSVCVKVRVSVRVKG